MYGLHPNKVHKWSVDVRTGLEEFSQHLRVVVIEEVGLDYTVSSGTWFKQSSTLNKILQMVKPDMSWLSTVEGPVEPMVNYLYITY